jgi:subtilisin family serine protease
MRKVVILGLIILLLVPLFGGHQRVQAAAPPATSNNAKIDPQLRAHLDNLQQAEMTPIVVTLAQQANLRNLGGTDRRSRQRAVIRALQARATNGQRPILAYLRTQRALGKVGSITPFWLFNGLSLTATPDVIQTLTARADVQRIAPDEIDIQPMAPMAYNPPETNLNVTNAPALWDQGYYGQGVVVANMDSGVDISHPDLAATWRGGSNSWYDPYGEHPTTPTDLSGHGTWTMGVMVGGEAGGTSLGMAPQAQWIAVKIFKDSGAATLTGIHQGFQWLLDPDGNPETADAPQVVNNSWAYGFPGCNLEFQLDLQALVAAGIVPVFSAGNYGSSPSTSVSPANYPEAFAVGQTSNLDLIANNSSRGPSACGEASSIYPELVAPGVSIHTTDLYGFYTNTSGTSLSAPHVAGALALLLSAYPDLSPAEQEAALMNSAADLGAAGPDNVYGYGRLDVLAAFQLLQANQTPTDTPTPPPTDTPTPLPTDTSTPGPTNTPTSLPTGTPTALPTSTPTPPPTDTPTPLPSATPTALPTSTPTSNPAPNLALNKTVYFSSNLDTSSMGEMAVDGNLATQWKSAPETAHSRSSEWIVVSLGSSMTISSVVLEWDANYATSYTVEFSNGSSWSTLYSTTGGDGANDTLLFNPVSARYVRLNTTAWTGSQRAWLRELQIFAGGVAAPSATPTVPASSTATPLATATSTLPPTSTSTPLPTNSPTPGPTSTNTSLASATPTPLATATPPSLATATATPLPTSTPTAGSGAGLHIGDLDGATGTINSSRWYALVTISVHDSSEQLVRNATVNGMWSNGATGSASCLTTSQGICHVYLTTLTNSVSSVTFSISSLTHATLGYQPSANHDPDGDSDGTTLVLTQP